MNMIKYEGILREINTEIEAFNLLLAQFRFDLLDVSSPSSWLTVADIPWKELDLGKCPHGDCPGLYVLCAHQKDNPTCIAVYIGKASVGNGTICNEIYSKLKNSPQKVKGIYTMNDLSGLTFIIEAVVAMGVREQRMKAFASALEEFVIDGVCGRIHLLNGTGNR